MTVEISRLSNGLTVVTDTMPHVESVALGIWVKAGSRNERSDQHGIAHLLEHMVFKGTGSRSAWDIASQIENVGGEINAATSVETTAFYARILRDDVPLAIDILSDIITDPRFDPDELEREQHVVLQEIGAAHDTPDDIVFDRFSETAFRHQTIGRSILGTPETVRSITAKDLRAFIDSNYGAERMVVVAAGDIDHDSFVRLTEARLGTFRAKANVPPLHFASYVGGDFRELRDLMDAQLVLGFEGRAYHVRDFYASQILAILLGGGMSSRLFQEIREKRGLCYSIYAFHWGFSDTGLFGVHAATGAEGIAELLPLIIEELRRASEGITEEELQRSIAQFRAGLLMSREGVSNRASQIARQMLLFGRPITLEELLDRLSKITIPRLTELSARLFAGKPTIAAVGPVADLADYDTVREYLTGPRPGKLRLAR